MKRLATVMILGMALLGGFASTGCGPTEYERQQAQQQAAIRAQQAAALAAYRAQLAAWANACNQGSKVACINYEHELAMIRQRQQQAMDAHNAQVADYNAAVRQYNQQQFEAQQNSQLRWAIQNPY